MSARRRGQNEDHATDWRILSRGTDGNAQHSARELFDGFVIECWLILSHWRSAGLSGPITTLRHSMSILPQSCTLRAAFIILCTALAACNASVVRAANITWNVGDGTWTDGAGNNANWSPNDEPDSDDVAIFNDNDLVELGSDNVVVGLTMSASALLDMKTFSLNVNGATSISGAGTRLFVDGGSVSYQTAASNAATINTSAGGALTGNGEVSNSDVLGAVTTVFDNNGVLGASNPSVLVITPPTAATLHLTATNANARIDLDGSSETGTVSVGRNQTLDIDVPLFDIFNGGITMSHNTKLDISSAWILGALATIDVDNGATGGIGGVSAGTSNIAGGPFAQNSGTITVLDNDGTLQFDAPFTMNGGTLTNNGLVVFNSTTTIGAAANFVMPTTASSFTVAANRTVNINQNNINLDGSNTPTNVITVNGGATLNINTTDYDPDSATNAFDGTINLESGTIGVNVADPEFVMDGALNMNASAGNGAEWSGDTVNIGNDVGVLDADLNVTGDGNPNSQARFLSAVNFKSDADVNIPAGAFLNLVGVVNFDTVNAANNAQFTGAGTIALNNVVNVNEAATLNMVGGTVDLDGNDASGQFINIDAPLTVNAATFSDFGRVNGGGGVNTLDINNNAGTGTLTVNLDAAANEWTLNAPGVINLVNDNTESVLLAGNGLNVNGTINVTGDVRTTARLDIGSTATVNINTAGEPFRLDSGGFGTDANAIAGGTINGPGTLAANTGRAIRGFGTINAPVDFDGTAAVFAELGTLTLNGAITDVGTIGTTSNDGILNIPAAWNSNVADFVNMNGGTLQGGAITVANTNGIGGRGTVTSRVINNTRLHATIAANTLVFETAANDNDWDGGANTGILAASNGSTLEVRDNATFTYGGTVTATDSSRVYAKGFGFNFANTSTINLTNSTLETDESTNIDGAINVVAGGDSTIKVQVNRFLTIGSTSTVTLNSNLRLQTNNGSIEAGATFSGPGAVIVPELSHLILEPNSNVNTLLVNSGTVRPSGFNTVGAETIHDYQQMDTGLLEVELVGTLLNQFDRFTLPGVAQLDGALVVDIDGAFVPALGNTFNIITATSGVFGTFDYVDLSGMPAGLTFHLNYLANAVQLQVVPKPIFAADFDDDGDVDKTDLAIWKNAHNLNQLGDADGDNDSDGADLAIWQREFGSHPGAAAGSGESLTAVPEPATVTVLAVLLVAVAACRGRGRGAPLVVILLCCVSVLGLANVSQAQSVSLSLNLLYSNPADHTAGGNWFLVAKTSSVNGISLVNAIMSNINMPGITYQNGIGAMLDGGNPWVINNGASVEVLYTQDLSTPANVVTDVGRGAGTPGNLAIDLLNDPTWNNAALIATGSFSGSKPAFVGNNDTPADVTEANVFTTKIAPFSSVAAVPLSTVVRESTLQFGDYNRNGTVDAADYSVWRETLGTGVSIYSGADGNGNGTIDIGDYTVWNAHFGLVSAPGSGLGTIAAVPEPVTLLIVLSALAAISRMRSRSGERGQRLS